MHDPLKKSPAVMAELFGKMPYHESNFFIIRKLDMKGIKVELPAPPIRSHIHCFLFITGGEALLTLGEELCYFKAGECATIPAGQVFSVRYFDNCTGFMGGFSTDFISENGRNPLQMYNSLRRWGSHKVLFIGEHMDYVTGILERLCLENTTKKNTRIIKAYLTTLLTEIEETGTQTSEKQNDFNTDNSLCNKFFEMVFEKCDLSISIASYANNLNISPDYLKKVIKQFTGKTPLTWIHESVILEARTLLFNTNMTISEISIRVGVEDPSYFSRLFKKHTGQSPMEYRKEHKISKNYPE